MFEKFCIKKINHPYLNPKDIFNLFSMSGAVFFIKKDDNNNPKYIKKLLDSIESITLDILIKTHLEKLLIEAVLLFLPVFPQDNPENICKLL
jgi:hypothetical protein